MRRYGILLVLTLAACPVEHAADDSAFPSHRDAGDADGALADAALPDLEGVDVTGQDLAQPDSASPDHSSGPDATPRDTAGGPDSQPPTDAAGTDTLGTDAATTDTASVDGATPGCESDDDKEPNDVAGEAKPLDLTQSYSLTGCDDDWFSFTLPAGKFLVVDALFSDALGDLDLKLYRADNITSSLDSSMTTSDNEQVGLPPQAAATPLLLLVDHFNGGTAPYTLQFTLGDPPANDTCAGAEVIAVPANGDVVTVTGNTVAAGDHRNSTLGCQTVSATSAPREVFYRFTASAGMTGHVFAELATDNWYGVLYAFADSCTSSTDLLCTTDTSSIEVSPGQTIYLAVDGDYGIDHGSFTLRLWYRPIAGNDTCDNAQAFVLPSNGNSVMLQGHTGEGTNTFQSASTANGYCRETVSYAPELFYEFTAPVTGTVQAQLIGDWDASLIVRDGGCATQATERMCWGRYDQAMDYLWHRFEVQQDQTYTVIVDGFGDVCCSASQGAFTLMLHYVVPPPTLQGGETCLNAVALPGASGSLRVNTAGAANDIDPAAVGCSGSSSGSGGDLFYTLSVPAGQRATLWASHTVQYFPLLLYVLNGECPVRGGSCLEDGQGQDLLVLIDDAPDGTLSWTNGGGTTQNVLVVIDAKFAGYDEDVDLSWIVQP